MPFTVEKMVFIRKNRNFISKTMFSRENKLEMPFYREKAGFYQEKQKFYLENELFYSKNISNAFLVLQWKRWFFSGKTKILSRKRDFL